MIDQRVIVHNSPKSIYAEAYRTIRSNIKFSSTDKEIKSILITSSGPEEGKSVTSINVAAAFASIGNRVLIIDADMRKPNLHKIMKTNNKSGLTNILSDHKDYKVVVNKTEINNMDIITCGPIPPNPSEILCSNSMKVFIEEVKKNYDIVIIDTPPVGIVTDAQVLTTLVDGVLLVVASGKTKVEEAKKAKELLQNVNANILGVILNRVKEKDRGYYYYGEEPDKKNKKKKT